MEKKKECERERERERAAAPSFLLLLLLLLFFPPPPFFSSLNEPLAAKSNLKKVSISIDRKVVRATSRGEALEGVCVREIEREEEEEKNPFLFFLIYI